jgi:hypothetical protein
MGPSLHTLAATYIPAHAKFRFANINGYYHGGEHMRTVFDEVLKDVQRCNITLPSLESLHFPVRSTINGKHLSQYSSPTSLLETILEHILVHRVDWNTTAESLIRDIVEELHQDQESCCRILTMGPNYKPLLRAINGKVGHQRLRVANFESGSVDGPFPDDIAIVGMSVNYPSADNPEMLWAALEKGLNVVQDVRTIRLIILSISRG